MGKVDYKAVVKTALGEVGYQGESKNSKYTKYLDDRNWYNYKKAGACTWCAIFYDYCIAVNKGNLTDEQARTVVCEPKDHRENSGAGCTQKADMYKKAGRWISSPSKATTGDQVFFKKSNGAIYHTGILVDWNSSGFYTVEGSTDGAKVSKRFYSYSDSKIAGFGRPDWYRYEEASEPSKPTPAPAPAPTTTKYKIKTNTGVPLRLRSAPNTSSTILTLIPNGATITVNSTSNGWAHTSYGGHSGWCSMTYLVKT